MPVRPLFFSCFLFTGFDAQIHGEVLGAGGGCLYIFPNKNYKSIGLNFRNLSDCTCKINRIAIFKSCTAPPGAVFYSPDSASFLF